MSEALQATRVTTPAAAARTMVPLGAAMSMPSWPLSPFARAYVEHMEHESDPGQIVVLRDEAQDLVPLEFGPLFAAARGRAVAADEGEDGVQQADRFSIDGRRETPMQ